VLPALHAVGEDLTHPRVQKAVNWLLERQNTDGGFGEVCESYIDITQHGRGVSTPSQTAWALIALMSVNIYDHPGVLAGVKYLCETINSTGTWNEDEYTGCGFPGFGDGRRADINEPNSQSELAAGFMINYHLYRHCWPLMALGRYEKYLKNKSK
jgi:squalene-hopene/tetraprenyl-beta-curcumene cyclase